MTKQKRFTKEVAEEAVRLVGTSGRTKRQIADYLGVGLSTLTRWMAKSRDRAVAMPDAAGAQDVMVNEILRQERDILKRATAFFVREESR